MLAAAEALSEAEMISLSERAFRNFKTVVLAVSGGADSLCLLPLATAAASALRPAPTFLAVTIDHGWRVEAGDEARWVAEITTRFGFPHHLLTWPGAKPETGRQEAARNARYCLFTNLAVDLDLSGPVAIATGHHSDDQAETFLMRLARGSGVDGLSGMLPSRPLKALPGRRTDLHLVRPFLSVPKARLVATLRKRGQTWIEDPGNANPAFERVRIRQALTTLQDIGIDAAAIGRSASRLAEARIALDAATDTLVHRSVEHHDGAMAIIAGPAFDAAPHELRLRLLQRLWPAFGGPGQSPQRSQLETLISQLAAHQIVAATLAGASINRAVPGGPIQVIREPGRLGLPELALQPGQVVIWDGRFEVGLAAQAATPVVIRGLNPAEATPAAIRPAAPPRKAVLALPAVVSNGSLDGVVHPAFPGIPGVWARFLYADLADHDLD